MNIVLLVCILTSIMHASTTINLVLLAQRPDLLSKAVDLVWTCQGKFQAGHNNIQPTAFLERMLSKAMNEDKLPLCILALDHDEPIGILNFCDTWTNDTNLAPNIASHPEWKGWLRGGAHIAPTHKELEEIIEYRLLMAVREKALKLGYTKLYVALSDEAKEQRYTERYGFEQFTVDTFHSIPIKLFVCDLQSTSWSMHETLEQTYPEPVQ